MLLCTENCLFTIRMVGKKSRIQSLPDLAAVLCKGHVLLLIYGLKFGVEASENRMLEPVCLNPGPVLNLVGRNVLDIGCHIL